MDNLGFGHHRWPSLWAGWFGSGAATAIGAVGAKMLHNSRVEIIGALQNEMKIAYLNKIAVDFDPDKEFHSGWQKSCAH